MAKYCISIIAFNKLTVTKRCVESVIAHSDDYELILTDNGSADNTHFFFEQVKKKLTAKKVTVIKNKENLGFQIPHKHALTLCESPYFILLNNDTAVPPHWLGHLEKPFKDDPKTALTGPFNACSQILPNFHGTTGAFEYLEGACLMCKTEVVRKLGLFSPYLEFAYGEDSDLSLRCREKGYSIHRVGVNIMHWRSTTAKSVPQIRYYMEKNHLTLCRVWSHYLKVRKFNYPIVIKRDAAIGDVLLTTPIIRQIKKDKPLSPIYVVTKFPVLFWKNEDVHTASMQLNPGPDSLIIDLNMAYENRPMRHIIESYAEVAECNPVDWKLHMPVAEEKVEWANEQLKDLHRPRAVIAPGPTTWLGKNWTFGRWSAISNYLKQKGWAVILIGDNAREPIGHTVDWRGRTDIHQSAAILQTSDLFIGLDSFPLHLAMSQRVPAIGLFGVTYPEFILSDGIAMAVQADRDLYPEIGQRHRERGTVHTKSNGECMRAILPDQVIASIDEMIGIIT
ncbi:MAG: glycosyltransferase [bacterium]